MFLPSRMRHDRTGPEQEAWQCPFGEEKMELICFYYYYMFLSLPCAERLKYSISFILRASPVRKVSSHVIGGESRSELPGQV